MSDASSLKVAGYRTQVRRPAPVWGPLRRALRQQQLTIVVAALGGLALGFVTGRTQRPEYEAKAILAIRSTANPAPRHPEIGEEIRARRVASAALKLAAAEAVIARSPERSAAWKQHVRESAARIETKVSLQSRIIEIVSRAEDPKTASVLANALAWEVILGDSPDFARIASSQPGWSDATIVERLERLRALGAESFAAAPAGGLPPQILQVLRVAQPDGEPLPAPWSEIAARTALAGLSLGLLAAALQTTGIRLFRSRRIRRPGEASQLLQIRELGSLPDLVATERRSKMTPAGRADEAPLCAETAAFHRPASAGAEQVRGVRTSLQALEPGRLRLIVVTSANRLEGKTTVAANLAISLAELGRRTALIDADLRRPRLHQVLNFRNRRGLFDMLSHKPCSPPELRRYALRVSPDRPLWLVPAGVAPYGAPGLLHDPEKTRLIAAFAAEYDHVVIDAPAVLAASDARALARLADGVVLVVRAGVTQPAEAMEAKQRLRDEGAHLLGVVLNSCDSKKRDRQGCEDVLERYPVSRPAGAHSPAA